MYTVSFGRVPAAAPCVLPVSLACELIIMRTCACSVRLDNMAYNQSAAEYYFIDQYNRIWTGLVNLMAAYSSSTSGLASPEHMKIAALFVGTTQFFLVLFHWFSES